MTEIMDVEEFITRDVDVDVTDDVCESLCIAFVGPLELTEEGKEHFADVLDYEIDLDEREGAATLILDNSKFWKEKLRKATEFFQSAAGYCSEDDYNRWFKNAE